MKIALILNDDFSMWQFRKGLISALVKRGFNVYIITPPGPYVSKIQSLGAVHIALSMSRFINPFNDLRLCFSLYRIFRREKFDIVHTMTIKPVIYGSIVARLARIKKVVGLISGSGFIFSNVDSLKLKVLKPFVVKMLKIGFRCCDKVWFQNPDDLNYFVEKKLIPKKKTVLIKGSGVNLEEFSLKNIDITNLERIKKEFTIEMDNKVVSMVAARLIWSKGVKEFLEAANMLKKKYPDVKFILVAPLDPESPDSVPLEYIDSCVSSNILVVTDFRNEVKEILAVSDIVALPSYYREGVPRVLLESLALAKPIVTTDHVGCREVVENGKNGYLVPIKDSKMLAKAIENLLVDDSLRKKFGRYARLKAEQEFDEKSVVRKVITELYQLQ